MHLTIFGKNNFWQRLKPNQYNARADFLKLCTKTIIFWKKYVILSVCSSKFSQNAQPLSQNIFDLLTLEWNIRRASFYVDTFCWEWTINIAARWKNPENVDAWNCYFHEALCVWCVTWLAVVGCHSDGRTPTSLRRPCVKTRCCCRALLCDWSRRRTDGPWAEE